MHLSRYLTLFVPFSLMITSACSFFSNTVNEIKMQCGVDEVDTNRSYVKVLDSAGKVLKSTEFALRWLEDTGRPLATQGHCIELDPKESAALIVRSRIGSEGLILEADGEDRKRLSSVQLEAYTYGPLRKTCDQIISINQLNLGLPVSFEDHTASGYEIKAVAFMDGEPKGRWNFVNRDPAAPNLDIGALNNGLYDFRFEFKPLFSEGGVSQFFNCNLAVDRKSPQISLIASDGLPLSNGTVELRPNSRVAWKSTNAIATEIVEYCFIASGTPAAECSNPSISSDPIKAPDSGSWKLVYRGVDAASNRSDWVVLEIDIVDEAKLANIQNNLELARVYQKSGQTQYVAIKLLLALDAYHNLSSENERARVKRELDLAIFQHQRDARDFFMAQWGDLETVNYLGTLDGIGDASTHAFLRQESFSSFDLSFIRSGSPLYPEVKLSSNRLAATCSSQEHAAYIQDGQLWTFDGKTLMNLKGDIKRLRGVQDLTFSEDCRFLVLRDSIGAFFLIDRTTGKSVDYPDFTSDVPCRFSFALGEADAVRYYSYCSPVRDKWELYSFSASGNIEAPKAAVLRELPLQLIARDNLIFVLGKDKSFAVLDATFNTLFSTPAGRMRKLIHDRSHQRILTMYENDKWYDTYKLIRSIDGQVAVKKLSLGEFRIPEPVRIGSTLTVSQPLYSPDLYYSRVDDSSESFFGQLPVASDQLLNYDSADLALVQSNRNVVREISPNASLLRRTIRLLRNEISIFPMTLDSETALYTMATETGHYSRYELDLRKDFIALANTPAAMRQLPKDYNFVVYPYGSRELILLKGSNQLQFLVWNEDGTERLVGLPFPPNAQAIPSPDPDLFWFYVPNEKKLYTVKASTGEHAPIESFQTMFASVAPRSAAAPIQIHQDLFAGHLYFAYPELVIKMSYRGALEKPEFFASESKALKESVQSLTPSRDFRKWVGMGSSLVVYNDAFEPEKSFSPSKVFGRLNDASFKLVASGWDSNTVFVTSGINQRIARIDIKSGLTTVLALDPSSSRGSLTRIARDDKDRLHYSSSSDWFILPLDLEENRQHLCRYLTELGSRMYSEVKAQFKQVSCKQP